MVHKKLSSPSSGAADKIYGVDYNKLIDHLERNTSITDPFTFNVNEHTIKDGTTNTAGDLLKSNGTKFIRLARGTANQVLAVNSGGTDVAWTTAAGGGDVTGAANVGSGTGLIFRDEVTGVLNLKSLLAGSNVTITNNANDITIASSGGAGGGDVSTTQSNTYGDFDQIFRSGRLDVRNPANTFSYSITGSAIAADRALTLPLLTAGDTLVAEAFGATLTNKTINATNNTITDTSTAAGDLLKSDGSKFVRLARGTANQVLTTNAGGTDLAWATPAGGGNVSTSSSNTYGDFDQVFRSGRLDVRNPADTFSYSITGSAIAADRALTLPLLTAGDTVVTEAFGATLTNKTVNATNNTITDTSTAAGDLMVSNGTKFVRKARGTSLQVLRTNSGATDIEYASLDSERVGKSQANGNGSTTVFNIAHGVGSNPTYAFVNCSSQTIAFTYTTDATNIVVTFASAPASGTNNVVMYWRVVA